MTEDVHIDRQGAWGVVTLNRPKALNSLTPAMCIALDEAVASWDPDPEVRAILIEGSGDRAFCAGGDIRALYDAAKDDPVRAAEFFRTEYHLNTRLSRLRTPSVALLDGVCMGGGVGVSIHAAHRVVTERTVWAMPECAIGLAPDVGASSFLNALPGGLPFYLGLTGARMTGQECRACGIGTSLQRSEDIPALRERLLATDDPGALAALLSEGADAFPFPEADEIDELFGNARSVEALADRLAAAATPLAEAARQRMMASSPTSLKLTHRLLSNAPGDFAACITREFRVVAHLMEGPDFTEGVRAQLVDKDKSPRWSPAALEDVSAATLDRYFEVPRGGDLDLSDLETS